MKKNNKALRVAAGLAVAAMLSTCLVSGTFAKYTTSGSGSDEARVAKFGVTVTGTNDSLFKKTYDGTVVSQNDEDVVAPGTKGTLTAVTLSGKPEVKVEVTNEATVRLSNWMVDGDFYCPLKVTVGSTTLTGTDYDSADEFQTAIENAINAISATYDAGTDLSTKTDARPAISWEWVFEGGQDGKQTDKKDTKLGDAANAKINISVDTTVTQID